MILVTGATGHIGNVLVRILVEKGKHVRAMILPKEDRRPLQGLPVEIVEANVLDPPGLQKAFSGIEVAYHLAGVISILPGNNQWVRQVNLEGTQNILEAARKEGLCRLVYTSSIHAVSRAPHGRVIDETLPFDPENAISDYDRSKAEASLAVQQACRQGLDAVIVCPTGVIGPYDYRRSEIGGLIYDSMHQKLSFGVDGAYDFVDVRDIAQGEIQACALGQCGESYILSGERVSILQLIRQVQKLAGLTGRLINIPRNIAHIVARFTPIYYRLTRSRPRFTLYSVQTVYSNSFISSDKAKRELNYRPRSIQESLDDTVRWFSENAGVWSS